MAYRWLFLACLLSIAGCTDSRPYVFNPEMPLGTFDNMRTFFIKHLGLAETPRNGLEEYEGMFAPAPKMFDYKIRKNDTLEKNVEHADDRVTLLADENGRLTAYVGYSKVIPRNSSRISRFNRRLWRKLGGHQPKLKYPLRDSSPFASLGSQDDFRANGVHGVYARARDYDTIIFIAE